METDTMDKIIFGTLARINQMLSDNSLDFFPTACALLSFFHFSLAVFFLSRDLLLLSFQVTGRKGLTLAREVFQGKGMNQGRLYLK